MNFIYKLCKKDECFFRLQHKTATLAGKAGAENPFLTAFSREKLVEAVPAERVRLKRKSNNKVTF
ncbi:hypothetical protein MM300_13440 [Evansella sp. LMS18]|uniref:hypothetical protein n=1 Tax=Evansella sp. LMS18 TaxID=2924033 RepID=UPI0020D072FF|nr:hypothetical protein [Evansella sp. LMS18]UTR08936.1 hypothetical protein MM300_13440 [Evansella sp. LMS18]